MRGSNLDANGPLLLEAGPSGMGGGPAHAPENPVTLVFRMMRGRWVRASQIGGALAVLGGVAGYFSTGPRYTSTGFLEIKPTLSVILYKTEDNQLPPLFESFVKAQAAYLTHPRVLDRAINDPALRTVAWPEGGPGLARLLDELTVVKPRGEQVITVKVQDDRPAAAAAAVNAVLKAYRELYGERAGLTSTERERLLEQRERAIEQELSTLKDSLARQQGDFGPEVQDKGFEARATSYEDVSKKLDELSLVIAQKETSGAAAAPAALPEHAPTGEAPTPAEEAALAGVDQALAGMVAERARIDAEIQAQSVRFGPNHQVMRGLRGQRDAKQALIVSRIDQLRGGGYSPQSAAAKGDSRAAMGMLSQKSIAELKDLETQYRKLKERLGAELANITRQRMAITSTQEDIEDAKKRLSETQKALDQTRTEQRNTETGRVSIQEGDVPIRPSSDKRIMRAAAGVVGGMGMGMGSLFLLGLLRGRYRYIDDLETGIQAPLLGTLPELSTGDGEHDELAAGSVHHVRNMLQLQHTRHSGEGARVYAVTSASAGEGKTSLSMALGMSFAAAGHRTLLIDADLFGRGLTRAMGMKGRDGLSEAAIASTLNGEVHEAGFPNVWAIPAGRTEGFDAQNLSKPRMAAVLDKVRAEFDIVIVDTGPLLGSIEANLAAALADGVVLMVTRGQDSKLVRACLKRIVSVGGVCAGLVFNRAIRQDFERSVSSNSFRSVAPRLEGQVNEPPSKSSRLLRSLGAGASEAAQTP